MTEPIDDQAFADAFKEIFGAQEKQHKADTERVAKAYGISKESARFIVQSAAKSVTGRGAQQGGSDD